MNLHVASASSIRIKDQRNKLTTKRIRNARRVPLEKITDSFSNKLDTTNFNTQIALKANITDAYYKNDLYTKNQVATLVNNVNVSNYSWNFNFFEYVALDIKHENRINSAITTNNIPTTTEKLLTLDNSTGISNKHIYTYC